jgi:hypothetical protein
MVEDEPVMLNGERGSGLMDGVPSLSIAAARRILGITQLVPLTLEDMAKSLQVAFYPTLSLIRRLECFLAKLRVGLIEAGIVVIDYEQALAEGDHGKIRKGIVLITPGEGESGNLAIDHVSSLSNNVVVGVLDGPCPATQRIRLQDKLNSVVSALVWHMVHVAIFVDNTSWTICNMNGAIITCPLTSSLTHDIFSSLVSKLAAPVVPPRVADFEVHDSALDLSSPGYVPHVRDMVESGKRWEKTGLLISQTPIDRLNFRSKKYKRIAAAYLDHRTGMSYGFLARQMPTPIEPALTLAQAWSLLGAYDWTENDFHKVGGRFYVALEVDDQRLIIPVPDVWVLCTRSGCEKTRLDPTKDIVRLGLAGGKTIFETPNGIGTEVDCKPSFDTAVILSHAIGNALIASVLAKINPRSMFCANLMENGLALAHWHGFLPRCAVPQGYFAHGQNNPPVSCSTPQASIYALIGKISAFQRSLEQGDAYRGDVHVEPYHGTNMSGTSLVELARLLASTQQ